MFYTIPASFPTISTLDRTNRSGHLRERRSASGPVPAPAPSRVSGYYMPICPLVPVGKQASKQVHTEYLPRGAFIFKLSGRNSYGSNTALPLPSEFARHTVSRAVCMYTLSVEYPNK